MLFMCLVLMVLEVVLVVLEVVLQLLLLQLLLLQLHVLVKLAHKGNVFPPPCDPYVRMYKCIHKHAIPECSTHTGYTCSCDACIRIFMQKYSAGVHPA